VIAPHGVNRDDQRSTMGSLPERSPSVAGGLSLP
jgi:hypothetical protein